MHDLRWVLGALTCGVAAMGAGCGSVGHNNPADAAVTDTAAIDAPPIDAPPDAPPDAACEKTLLVGGSDPVAQGWQIIQQAPAAATYSADYTQLLTSTPPTVPPNPPPSSGGQLLLARASAVPTDQPFKLQVVMQVVSIDDGAGDDMLDAGVAIMGSITGSVGTPAERAQIVSVYPDRIVWADNTEKHTVSLIDGAFHTYVLAVDAARTATLSLDGTVVLTRASFATSGTIAIGDQTNDAHLDATTRIKLVKLLCVD